jgi:hypothetical protein
MLDFVVFVSGGAVKGDFSRAYMDVYVRPAIALIYTHSSPIRSLQTYLSGLLWHV